MSYIDDYLNEAASILNRIERNQIEKMIQLLLQIR